MLEQSPLEVHTVALWMLQWPACTQSELCWQATAVWILQWPPERAQLAFDWQLAWVILHLPTCEQSLADMQLVPFTLQVPGSAGQLAFEVQLTPVWMLQFPGLGVQTGGAQLVVPVHGFSGSGGSRLQPGGL